MFDPPAGGEFAAYTSDLNFSSRADQAAVWHNLCCQRLLLNNKNLRNFLLTTSFVWSKEVTRKDQTKAPVAVETKQRHFSTNQQEVFM